MAYAHWEGYVKSSFDKLAETIARRKPSLKASNDAFAFAHIKHLLLRTNSGDPDASAEMMDLARGATGPRLRLRKEELVRTHDNLRYEYFHEIIAGFGFDQSPFELSQNFVDTILCDRRNFVAHGRGSFPSADSVLNAVDRVLELLILLKTAQVELLVNKRYLR